MMTATDNSSVLPDDIAIELNGINKQYLLNDSKVTSLFSKEKKSRIVKVLDNIDLTVKKGEILGLIGRNGCGKTTLMKILAGMTEQTSGTVNINGKMVCIIESGSLFISDESGYDNIIYRGMLYGLTRAEIKAKVDDIARYAELGDSLDKPVRTYSLGMKSRLGFAIMAFIDADIYILDEALNAGDSIFGGKAIKFLNQLSMKGKTILMTSHSGSILRDVCSRIILLDEGRIVADGPFVETYAKYRRTMLTSVETMEEAAQCDNPQVEYALAKIKQRTDPVEYEHLLKEAAIGRNADAMVEYGDILLDKGEYDSAIEYYKSASMAGNEDARIRYAMAVTGTNKQDQAFMKAFAELGDHFDEYRYGKMLLWQAAGIAQRSDVYAKLSKAYEHGNLEAGYEISLMKIIGNGTDPDMKGAVEILSENAKSGHMKSAKRLYELYSDGKYVDVDMKEAFKWCEIGAKMGDPKLQFSLAMMYTDGIGTEKNDAKAEEWLTAYVSCMTTPIFIDTTDHEEHSGIEPDTDAEPMSRLLMRGYNDRITYRVMGDKFLNMKRSESESVFNDCQKYCTTSRLMGMLAKCYLEGIGVECDEKEAFRLYGIAANAGDGESMYILARMYKNGIGTEQDLKQYERWVRLAARKGQFNATMIIKEKDEAVKNRIRHSKSK